MPQSPTANMSLILPTEGGDANDWDVILDSAFGLIDEHDHSTGRGVKVPSAGLNINADLSFGGLWAPTNLRAVDFAPVAPAGVSTLAGAFFVNSSDSNNLYFRTVSGSNVKVTDGTSLNVAAFTGGIGGDYAASGALVAYVAADDRYTFKGPDPGGGRPWESIGMGRLDIYEQGTTVTNRVRIQSPSALAASYALTLPAALPGSTQIAQVSSAGVVSTTNTIAESITLASNKTVQVQGTGKYKHATKYVMVPLNNFDALPQSGTVANNGGEPGITPDDGIDLYYPLPDFLSVDHRVVSISLYIDSTPGIAITYTFALSGFVTSTLSDGSDTLSSTSATPTLTLATPWSLAPADNGGYYVRPWIKIEIPSTVNVVFTHMRVGFDAA